MFSENFQQVNTRVHHNVGL